MCGWISWWLGRRVGQALVWRLVGVWLCRPVPSYQILADATAAEGGRTWMDGHAKLNKENKGFACPLGKASQQRCPSPPRSTPAKPHTRNNNARRERASSEEPTLHYITALARTKRASRSPNHHRPTTRSNIAVRQTASPHARLQTLNIKQHSGSRQ